MDKFIMEAGREICNTCKHGRQYHKLGGCDQCGGMCR